MLSPNSYCCTACFLPLVESFSLNPLIEGLVRCLQQGKFFQKSQRLACEQMPFQDCKQCAIFEVAHMLVLRTWSQVSGLAGWNAHGHVNGTNQSMRAPWSWQRQGLKCFFPSSVWFDFSLCSGTPRSSCAIIFSRKPKEQSSGNERATRREGKWHCVCVTYHSTTKLCK